MSLTPVENRAETGAIPRPESGIKVLDQPVSPQEKARYVREMFDAIAPRYDLLNSLLSLRIHHHWRTLAARCAALQPGDDALDVATGTGDFARELRKRVGSKGTVTGVDFSRQMLISGADKFQADGIAFLQGDAQCLPFPNQKFDAAVIGFGLRNVAQPILALGEMARVVRPGGRVVCLEFAQPKDDSLLARLFRLSFAMHSKYITPTLGGLISGRREAYSYLPESVARWHTRTELAEMMHGAGLVDVRIVDLTFGIVCIHVGTKPSQTGSHERIRKPVRS